jgi:hypothetical protein
MATLKTRFEELIHLEWGEFVDLELDKSSSVDDVVLCSLIRACADGDDVGAIKMAFDRIDGLQETPIEIKVPKFYTRYVNAKKIEPGAKKLLEAPESSKAESKSTYDPATAKLRETLQEMRSMPQDVIRVVRLYKKRIEDGKPVQHDPKVKSVIVANLLKKIQKGKFRAVELVFDQIDGKLTKTITLLGGDDVYVDDYNVKIAPADSIKGEDGVYYGENKVMTTAWLRGFASNQKGLSALAEGLEDEY